jgi:hypothetical protein
LTPILIGVTTTITTVQSALTDFQACSSRGCRECCRGKHAFTRSAAVLAYWAQKRAFDTGEHVLLCANFAFTVAHCRHSLTALQVRHQCTRKLLVSKLAKHGPEHDAQEALHMFEALVKLRVTQADRDLSSNVIRRGRTAGQRLQSAAEVGVKRQRSTAPVQV